jgi:alginate O-acetyltransferase complex protein AlgI
MLFTSPEFLFAFLPVFLGTYFLVAERFRNAPLFLASLFFYYTMSGELALVLIASVIVNFFVALRIDKTDGGRRKFWLILGIVINLLPLIFYKYAAFFMSNVNETLDIVGITSLIPVPKTVLPIGISFFTFQALSYIADVTMRRIKPSQNMIDFGMYHACFPQLIAGPIVRYEDIQTCITSRTIKLDDVYAGAVRFCFGFAKKIILADSMGKVADVVFATRPEALHWAPAWIGMIAYTLQIYFDFSGYSDMAIGIGRILGFTYPENFNQPYRSINITEFWRRWHMTLSQWFRDYVYIPLGGNRGSTTRTTINLMIVFFLCGLWHGAAWTFVVWGLWHGGLLLIERYAIKLTRIQIPPFLAWSLTMIAVMAGWVLFRSSNLGDAWSYLMALGQIRQDPFYPVVLVRALPIDKCFYMALAIIVALFPFERLEYIKQKAWFVPLQSVAACGLFAMAIIMMAANGFNPFIYFRF